MQGRQGGIPAYRVRDGRVERLTESLAREAPLEVRVAGRSHTILMATPADLADLALGFALSEGLVERPQQVEGVELGQAEVPGLGPAHWVDLSLPPDLARRARVRRVAPAATSCGLCGLESLADLTGAVAPVASEGPSLAVENLTGLFASLEGHQPLFTATGGTHACALGDARGELVLIREDVGRHNALDKTLGAALSRGLDLGRHWLALSGRVSYEMALKSARAGVPLVASISAPTALGRELLEGLGVTLVGFVRPGRLTVYSHPRRLTWQGRPLGGG